MMNSRTSSPIGLDTLYLFASTIIFVITGYVINIWLGRYLGPEGYGRYGVIIALMSALNLFQTSGLPQALSKFLAQDEKNQNAIFKSGLKLQILSTTVLTVGYFLLAYPIALLLNDLSLISYIQLSALVLPFYAVFAFYTGLFNGLQQFKKQALINIIYSVAKFFGVIVLSFFFKLSGALIGFIIAPLFIFLYRLPLPKNDSSTFTSKQLFFYSLPLLTFVIFVNLQQTIDLYFIKSLLKSDALVGFYTANQNITKLPYIGLSTVIGILFPTISKNVSQNLTQASRDLIHQVLRIVLLILCPLVALIAAFSDQIIVLLYSEAFLPAAPSLSVLVLGFAFLTLFSILANILNGAGDPYKAVAISLVGLVITMLLCLLLIPTYGLVGAAFATTFASGIAMGMTALFVYRRFHALVNPVRVIKIFSASLVLYVLAFFSPAGLVFFLLTSLLLLVLYLGLLYLFQEVTKEELMFVQHLLQRKRS